MLVGTIGLFFFVITVSKWRFRSKFCEVIKGMISFVRKMLQEFSSLFFMQIYNARVDLVLNASNL